jgi:hypothetical protein
MEHLERRGSAFDMSVPILVHTLRATSELSRARAPGDPSPASVAFSPDVRRLFATYVPACDAAQVFDVPRGLAACPHPLPCRRSSLLQREERKGDGGYRRARYGGRGCGGVATCPGRTSLVGARAVLHRCTLLARRLDLVSCAVAEGPLRRRRRGFFGALFGVARNTTIPPVRSAAPPIRVPVPT